MPINDLLPDLMRLLTNANLSGTQQPGVQLALDPQAVQNPLDRFNRRGVQPDLAQVLSPDEFVGQSPIDLFALKPESRPNPFKVLRPQGQGAGGAFSLSPRLPGGGGDDLLASILGPGARLGGSSVGGEETGETVGNMAGRLLAAYLSSGGSEVLGNIPGLGSVLGKIGEELGGLVGGIFGGGVSHRVVIPDLTIPENLSTELGFDIKSYPIHASSFRHAWDRIKPIIDSVSAADVRMREMFAEAGFPLPSEFGKGLPHSVTARVGSPEGPVGYQIANQQSVALLSISLKILEQLKSEQGSGEFTEGWLKNPSIESLFRLFQNQ